MGEETAQVTQLSLLARGEGEGGRHRGSSRTGVPLAYCPGKSG